jgi:caffeoyl-CoA O-methyltransferase
MDPGGVLVADNVLFGGRITLPESELEEKYRGGVALLKKFNDVLSTDERFAVRFFAEGDGIAVGVLK